MGQLGSSVDLYLAGLILIWSFYRPGIQLACRWGLEILMQPGWRTIDLDPKVVVLRIEHAAEFPGGLIKI